MAYLENYVIMMYPLKIWEDIMIRLSKSRDTQHTYNICAYIEHIQSTHTLNINPLGKDLFFREVDITIEKGHMAQRGEGSF